MLLLRRWGAAVRARAWALPLLYVLVLQAGASTTDPFRGDAIFNAPFVSLTYGVQAFLWWDQTAAALRLDQIRTMVFSHVKQTFSWKDVEPVRGEWHFERGDWIVDEVERRGLQLVVRLSDTPDWALPPGANREDFLDSPPADLRDFATYCGTVAARYVGRVSAYQIWNEPNLSREWGGHPPDAVGFTALLRACAEAIRATDPDAILISPGLAPTGTDDATATPDDVFLQRLYDAGFQRYIDVVGVHAPGYSRPELSPDEAERMGSHRFFTFRRVEDLRKIMVANGDAARQMAVLEVGWTTDTINPAYSWFAVSEKVQARHLVAAFRYAAEHWRPWVGLMSVIYIADPGWDLKNEEFYWSIITPEGWQRPAYVALANMPKYCGNRVIPARDPNSPEARGEAPVELCLG